MLTLIESRLGLWVVFRELYFHSDEFHVCRREPGVGHLVGEWSSTVVFSVRMDMNTRRGGGASPPYQDRRDLSNRGVPSALGPTAIPRLFIQFSNRSGPEKRETQKV